MMLGLQVQMMTHPRSGGILSFQVQSINQPIHPSILPASGRTVLYGSLSAVQAGGVTAAAAVLSVQGTHVGSGAVATRRLIPSVGLHMTQGLSFPGLLKQIHASRDHVRRPLSPSTHQTPQIRARRRIGMPLETTWTS